MRTSGLSLLSPTDVRHRKKSMLRLLHQFGTIAGPSSLEKIGRHCDALSFVVKTIGLETQSAHRRRAEAAGYDPNQRGHAYRDQR